MDNSDDPDLGARDPDEEYQERADATLAKRLLMHLREMEVISEMEVHFLLSPSWQQIEDAE